MRKKFKIGIILVIAMTITYMITSCAKREPVDMQELSGEQTESEYRGATTKGYIKERLSIENSWEEKLFSSNQKEVKIYAEVIVPACYEMKVYKAKNVNFDNKTQKQYISAGDFDELFYFEEEDIPKEVWAMRRDYFQEQADNTSKDSGSIDGVDLVVYYAQMTEEMEQKYEHAPDDYKVLKAYDSSHYLGIKKNRSFQINAGQTSFEWYVLDHMYAPLFEEYDDGVFFNVVYGEDFAEKNAHADNKCSIPRESMEAEVYKYLERFGLSEYKITSANELQWEIFREVEEAQTENRIVYDTKHEIWNDGYAVSLTRTLDGIEVVSEGSSAFAGTFNFEAVGNCIEIQRADNWSNNEFIQLMFNDDGLLMFSHQNPFAIMDVVVGNVDLLDFEQIKELFRTIIQNSSAENVVTLNVLELKYIMMYDTNNSKEFSIIPAWFLSSNVDNNANIVINAVDGSLILNLPVDTNMIEE